VREALGSPIAPDAPDPTEEILLCRVDVLCLRKREPLLAGRGPVVPPRPAPVPRPSVIASIGLFSPNMLCPPGAGKRFLKSSDADAMLLWRSSKLGEGRNSKVPVEVEFSSAAGGLLNEKRGWLLRVDALRVGSFPEATRGRAAVV
jgi:hypothetical protein